ncbi:hypothetical protein E2C01_095895 [Portunus trituberculatus]|uniref:Uncharacterized protein n=1 Tax=Portunus trituberculatus TaxID=210409 RepID=A0A5B7K1C5_PORTR|nr:hypothetical protein [Portunus trituberculatus]
MKNVLTYPHTHSNTHTLITTLPSSYLCPFTFISSPPRFTAPPSTEEPRYLHHPPKYQPQPTPSAVPGHLALYTPHT